MDQEAAIEEATRAGLLRRRLRGGHRATTRGTRYLRDAILRYPDLREQGSKHIDAWEAGALTKAGRRDALVELIATAWEKDALSEAEALADLRARGFDPLAPS